MPALHFEHACAKGGPNRLPVTWDRNLGGGRVSCPVCGANKLAATLRNNVL